MHTAHARAVPVPTAPPELELADPAPDVLPPEELAPDVAHPEGSSQQLAATHVPPVQGPPTSATGHSYIWADVGRATAHTKAKAANAIEGLTMS